MGQKQVPKCICVSCFDTTVLTPTMTHNTRWLPLPVFSSNCTHLQQRAVLTFSMALNCSKPRS